MTPATARLAVVMAVLALLPGCTSGEDAAETRAVLGAIMAEFEEDPDVVEASASLDESTGVTLAESVDVFLVTGLEDEEAIRGLARDVAERVWHSDVPSVTSLQVHVESEPTGATFDTSDLLGEVLLQRDALEAEFGPREAG